MNGEPATEDLRAAAFGDRPGADVLASAATGSPRQRWLAAVALGGQGRYAAAATTLLGLRACRDPLFVSLAASTLASHRRQLGAHLAARTLDAAALAAAGRIADAAPDPDGVDLAGARSDALLGLAADALGVGRLGLARRLLAEAGTEAAADAGWRSGIRVRWVAAEIELAAGRPGDAVPAALRAAELANGSGSLRHRVKSDLVLGAALSAEGARPGKAKAHALLAAVMTVTHERGVLSLAWPTALLLADLEPDRSSEHREVAARVLSSVFSRADGTARRLAVASPWVPTALVRSSERPQME